jgi:cellulose synthase/poly-beta-1,6-N-acetylglucosamine synthase-like glycosyltransferase
VVTIFFLSVFFVIYSYALYPLCLKLLPIKQLITAAEPAEWPTISLIITAHNEASRIAEKLDNSLAINYPKDKLHIIVASDCSSDSTDNIVTSYSDKGIQLVRADQHLGKEYAQYCAIQQSHGDIIVFSDVSTDIPTDAITTLASYFTDPKVGAVSSEDRFISDGGKIVGESAYVRYEMWLRALESQHAGLVGLSGSFFAARRAIVIHDWDTQSPSDFNTALQTSKAGLIAISCPDVLGYYKDIKDEKKEYSRKVRTVIRGITALARHTEVLNPTTFGLFSFQVISHKLLRWAVPWFLLLAALSNMALIGNHWLYNTAALTQLLLYGMAFSGWRSTQLRQHVAIRIVFFFIQVNLAIAEATVKFITGTRMTVWAPSAR